MDFLFSAIVFLIGIYLFQRIMLWVTKKCIKIAVGILEVALVLMAIFGILLL